MVVASGLIPFESQVVEIDHQLLKFIHGGVQSKKSVKNMHSVKSNALNVVQNM